MIEADFLWNIFDINRFLENEDLESYGDFALDLLDLDYNIFQIDFSEYFNANLMFHKDNVNYSEYIKNICDVNSFYVEMGKDCGYLIQNYYYPVEKLIESNLLKTDFDYHCGQENIFEYVEFLNKLNIIENKSFQNALSVELGDIYEFFKAENGIYQNYSYPFEDIAFNEFIFAPHYATGEGYDIGGYYNDVCNMVSTGYMESVLNMYLSLGGDFSEEYGVYGADIFGDSIYFNTQYKNTRLAEFIDGTDDKRVIANIKSPNYSFSYNKAEKIDFDNILKEIEKRVYEQVINGTEGLYV